MDLGHLIDKWVNYFDAAVIAIFGQLGMQGFYWAAREQTGCSVNRVIGWIMVAAVLGMMTKAAAPAWFPGLDAFIFGIGMFAMVVFARLRVTMPAWLLRIAKGAGSPFDQPAEDDSNRPAD